MRFLTFAALTSTLLCLTPDSARAKATGRTVMCTDVPRNWQPAISFYTVGRSEGTGVFFFQVAEGSPPRVERLFAAYDIKNGPCAYWVFHDISLPELRETNKDYHGSKYNGYVITEASKRRIVTLYSSDASDSGGTIQMPLLKEANATSSDDYSPGPSFTVAFNGHGQVVPKRNGNPFNLIAFTERKKWFFTKGTIAAGIKKVAFCNYNCREGGGYLKGQDYIP